VIGESKAPSSPSDFFLSQFSMFKVLAYGDWDRRARVRFWSSLKREESWNSRLTLAF
jgi:hypothetical protein